VSLIVQLSDLHLLARDDSEQAAILDSLLQALKGELEARRAAVDLVAITGDVFDSGSDDPKIATARFDRLFRRLQEVLGGEVMTVIVPGNHDRRRGGLFAPHREELFCQLRDVLGSRAFVHGCRTPFLSALVPHDKYNQPFWVVAYDSSYLPRGLISAGGALRQEDLLYAASRIEDEHPDWPVVFLLHHHLVPTPLTDVGPIVLQDTPAIVRWGIQRVLPALVSHADREELTMTALGAGTALSTLHTLGRAVIVLHGHKHYATARLLDGVAKGEGDVLIVSAGSSGTAQPWYPTSPNDAARLWPSYNLIDLSEHRVSVDTISFGWKTGQATRRSRRPLVVAERRGAQWVLEHIERDEFVRREPLLDLNEARFDLEPSWSHGGGRWDASVERRVQLKKGARLRRYSEIIDGLRDAELRLEGKDGSPSLPAQVRLDLRGKVRYRLNGGICRTLGEAQRRFGDHCPPFASVSLMNRYGSSGAVLEVRGISDRAADAFASATDLGTGLEKPMRVQRDRSAGSVRLEHPACPPRTLLRIYWQLVH
jgi:3',5'-cyclic AMP phosphodiesterase CpdA